MLLLEARNSSGHQTAYTIENLGELTISANLYAILILCVANLVHGEHNYFLLDASAAAQNIGFSIF